MSTRPPPLRASDRPPTYRMVTRVYNNSLRPVIIVIGSITAIWTLLWAIPAFQDINEDKQNGQPKFAIFDIVLGTIYAAVCAIEVFGVLSAATQRLAMVRIYAMLSLVASIAMVGAGFLRVIVHFAYKACNRTIISGLVTSLFANGLIDECEKVAQGQGVEFRFGIWGPRVTDQLTAAEAATFCNNAWNRDSLDEILFLIFEIFFAIFFSMIAFAYYHQVRDPTSAANVARGPANVSGGPGPYPDHYNRPYDTEGGYVPPYPPYDANPGYQPQYAPPPGPPPADVGYGVGMGHDVAKDREVKGDNESEMTKFDDPFADFDGPSKPKSPPLH